MSKPQQTDRPQRPVIYIMRGQSGAGKSTWIRDNLPDVCSLAICSADHWFIDPDCPDGTYRFDPARLPFAHAECWHKALRLIERREPTVIIDNTNANPDHAQKYIDAARVRGYRIVVVTCLTDQMDRGIHGCPESTAYRQWDQIMRSLRPWGADPDEYPTLEYLDVYTD